MARGRWVVFPAALERRLLGKGRTTTSEAQMIETWGFYLFAAHDPWGGEKTSFESVQASYEKYLNLWTRCEDWGFDGLAWAEHHFSYVSLSPSPHLLVATVAARTKRLRLTTLGSVLPLHDPRRYVEECAMLDYLTGGRFEPGIAPGAGPREAVAAGLSPDELRPRYYGGADLLAKALAGRRVTHKDAYSNLENVAIVPPLRLRQGQSVWVTVMSPDSAAWAAERGYKLCTGWLPTPMAAALAERYRAAADAAGRPVTPSMLAMRRRVFVADTDAEARERHEEARDLVIGMSGSFETADEKILKLVMQPDDFAIGSPKTVAEKLISQCRAGGYGAIMAFTDFAQFAPGVLERSHELIGTQVAPILRSADVGSKGRAAAE